MHQPPSFALGRGACGCGTWVSKQGFHGKPGTFYFCKAWSGSDVYYKTGHVESLERPPVKLSDEQSCYEHDCLTTRTWLSAFVPSGFKHPNNRGIKLISCTLNVFVYTPNMGGTQSRPQNTTVLIPLILGNLLYVDCCWREPRATSGT